MTLKVGQTYKTRSQGEVKVLELNAPLPQTPVVVITKAGQIYFLSAEGKMLNNSTWDIQALKETGYIHVYRSALEATKHAKPGQITVPFEYEAPEE